MGSLVLGSDKFWNININKTMRADQDREEAKEEYEKSVKMTYEDLFVKHAAVENEA